MRPIIEINGLWKQYRRGALGAQSLREQVERWWRRRGRPADGEADEPQAFWALRDVNLHLAPGSVTGLIGKNGAGKSTLLKVLSGITEPSRGEVRLRGRVASLLEVGTGFHPELSGRENVFLNGAILGMRRAEIRRKFDEIVAFAEVEEFLDTPVKRYSSGMYVRLAFAVAAHLEPEILIVDEVLAVGDEEFQRKCLGKMEAVARGEGRTVILVSHNLAAVRRLCPQAVVLRRGEASPVEPTESAIARYLESFRVSGTDLEVAERPREPERAGEAGARLRVERVRLVGDGLLAYGQPWEVEVTVEVAVALEDVALVLGFNTIEGVRVLTLESDLAAALPRLAVGRHAVRLRLAALPLAPGHYRVGVAALRERVVLDRVQRIGQWEVHSGEGDITSDRGFGGCRLAPEVTYLGTPT